VSIYTLIYNVLPYNKIFNAHDYVEWGLGKVGAVCSVNSRAGVFTVIMVPSQCAVLRYAFSACHTLAVSFTC
jgi:hypothetical protein